MLAVPNGGNVEYLEDGKNCLLYEQGDIEQAVSKINQLCTRERIKTQIIYRRIKDCKRTRLEQHRVCDRKSVYGGIIR